MDDMPGLKNLKTLGSGIPAPAEAACLYHLAFDQFGPIALWSTRRLQNPTIAAALAITESLRVEGNLHARRLAEQIEQACRAALYPPNQERRHCEPLPREGAPSRLRAARAWQSSPCV